MIGAASKLQESKRNAVPPVLALLAWCVNWQGSEMNDSALSEVPREGFLSNAVSCQVSQTLPACDDGEKHLAARL